MNDRRRHGNTGRGLYFIKSRPVPRNKYQEYSDLAKYPPADMSREEWCKWLARELKI